MNSSISRTMRARLVFGAGLLLFVTAVLIIAIRPLYSVNTPTLRVDVAQTRHSISPYVYGINFASQEHLDQLNVPFSRWGGNATSRYNYIADATNRGLDWYFLNTPNEADDVGALPAGSSADRFVRLHRNNGADALLTLPMTGWVTKDRGSDCGFPVSMVGAQDSTEYYHPDCGNGYLNGTALPSAPPENTSIAVDHEFVRGWISHLTQTFGPADQGGVRFYSLDNEPMLWNHTHRDVHPAPASYDEVFNKGVATAAVVKQVDPSAKIFGPTVWGWTAYFYSALDAESGPDWWNNAQDRNAHGGQPFLEWYLSQMRIREEQTGIRHLDYLDLHFYPVEPGVMFGEAGDTNLQAKRLQSTRALWDAGYNPSDSWIGEPVRLIPRMHDWVNNNYPGTQLALTEYNWGALDHINGALTQADILGIFGRENMHVAALWDPPQVNQPGAYAFRMYRNYDGNRSTFGDQSLLAESGDQSTLAVYAARRSSDGVLTIMVVNKSWDDHTTRIQLDNYGQESRQVQVYRYSQANLNAVVRENDLATRADGFDAFFPAQSISLFVVTNEENSNPPPDPVIPTETPTPVPNPQAGPVRIMPLGDSITEITAYRDPLVKMLDTTSCTYDMVGSARNNWVTDWDADHEGHGGLTAYYLNYDPALVTGWVSTYQPDIVLLHMGTNDMWGGGNAAETAGYVEGIINQVRSAKSDTTIFVAQIIPGAPFDVSGLNAEIFNLAARLSTADSQVIPVDLASGFDTGSDTYDGVHPNENGGRKMAEDWFNSLQANNWCAQGSNNNPPNPPNPTPTPPPDELIPTPTPVTTDYGSNVNYSYYEGDWQQLPDFNTLTAKKSGLVNNFSMEPRDTADLFAFQYSACITLPAEGNYRFYTVSDDGSKLWINGTEVVNNDGLHGLQEQSGGIPLGAGEHAIEVAAFERYGDEALQVYVEGPGIGKQLVPDGWLKPSCDGEPPAPPAPIDPATLTQKFYLPFVSR